MKRSHSVITIFSLLFLLFKLFGCQSGDLVKQEPVEEITAVENNLKNSTLVFEGETQESYNILDRMGFHNVPGVSIAVFRDGKLSWARGYGYANTETMDTIDENTVFQAGSISKPVAALAALKLVDEGKVDLDENVNTYLKDWKVPENSYTQEEEVTLRRLLTHTAGLTVHGFPGYEFDEEIPSVVDVLNGEGNTSPIQVDTFPGSIWRYSGGGYTIMQLLVEDVSGEDFAEFVQREVLTPLGMDRSTYVQPLPKAFHDNASAAFDGREAVMAEGLWNNYPEKAAAGLWTTPSDLVKYCIDIQTAMSGGSSKVLSEEMVKSMLTKHQNDWGLGPALELEGDLLTFGHGGKNRGFSNLMRAFVHNGEGAIVMTNADEGRRLMGEIMVGISDYYGWDWYQLDVVKKVPMGQDQLRSFEGRYVLSSGEEGYPIELQVKENYLEVDDIPENRTYQFYPISDVDFIYSKEGHKITFVKNATGEVIALDYFDNGRFRFEKE
jgi:CubicO group peptidase (beta-lactamase class C family)